MDDITDFMPPSGTFRDPEIERNIAAVRAAAAGEPGDRLPEEVAVLAERMRQAREKMASSSRISRLSELIALAQFGPGSAARAVAWACRDDEAAPIAESVYVGGFLSDIAASSAYADRFLPEGDGAVGPLIERSATALSVLPAGSAPSLRRHLRRRKATALRLNEKTVRRGPSDRKEVINLFDRLLISCRLMLGSEHGK